MIASSQPIGELLPPASVNALDTMLRNLGLGDAKLTPVRGGGNNKTFRVDSGATTLFLKAYFRDRDDSRDRLAAEFAFARLAWDHGIRTVPQPLAKDDATGQALFEFVYGRRLDRTEINVTHIEQALTFLRRLSTMHYSPGAALLPVASEACFTLDEHVQLVERRVRNLVEMPIASVTDGEAASFVQNELAPAWHSQVARLTRRAEQAGLSLMEPLAERDRCISPSDFGFHNAVLEAGGRLRFVDFEYAGWDDPAKLVCDFFCQPQVPVPRQFLDSVASTVVEPLQNRGTHRRRIELLWPIYRVKWCCIMLNLFAPVGARRRAFSGTAEDLENVKKTQLALARQALRSLIESTND
jgi:hypothetical protein